MIPIEISTSDVKLRNICVFRASGGRVGNSMSHVYVDLIVFPSGSHICMWYVTTCRFEYDIVMEI